MHVASGDIDSGLAVIALDVGGTSVKSALVVRTDFRSFGNCGSCGCTHPTHPQHPNNSARNYHSEPIDSEADADCIIGVLAGIITTHLSQLSAGRLLGVALGFPGPFDYSAGVSYIAGVEKFATIFGLDVGAALRQRLNLPDLPLRFRNDAEAAILGEACYGAGRPYRRLTGITLGTGCGSSFVSDGLAVTEGPGVPNGGWVYPLLFNGERADDLFSRRGLEARLGQAVRLQGADDSDIKGAASAARNGNVAIQSVFENFGCDLGEFLAPLAASFHAQALLILGQISGAFDLFGPFLQRALDRYLHPPIPALPGELGAQAALLGAADLFYQTPGQISVVSKTSKVSNQNSAA